MQKKRGRQRKTKKRRGGTKETLAKFWKEVKHFLQRWVLPFILAVIVGYLVYPFVKNWLHQEPVAKAAYHGIDVSKHQGKINWKLVASDKNIQFVYIKATEGASVVDSRYTENIKAAREAGLRVGSYHFFRGYKSAEDQFVLFSKYVKKGEQDLLPMVDVEEIGNRHVGKERLQKNLTLFMELVKREYGKYPLLYSQYRFYNEMLAPEFNKYFIFIARYSRQEPILKGEGKYNIWQYTEKGKIQGIKGNVDLDKFANGTTINDISFH